MDKLIQAMLKYIKDNLDDANLSVKFGNELSQLIRENSINFVDKKEYELLQKQLENIGDYEEVSKQANYWQSIKQTFDIETPENLIEKTKGLSKQELEKLKTTYEEKQNMITQNYETKINEYQNNLNELKNNYKKEKMTNIAKELNIKDEFQNFSIYEFSQQHIIKDGKVYLKGKEDIPLNKDNQPLTEIEAYRDFISTKETWQKPSGISGAGSSNGKSNNEPISDNIKKVVKKYIK